MGAALAAAAVQGGHEVIVLSGPVAVAYPSGATVVDVVTTDDLLAAADRYFVDCDGLIGAAAPCDYRPRHVSTSKLAKDGQTLSIDLIETPDVVAKMGRQKLGHQWVVGFALETEDRRFRATVKLQRKHCDLIVSNGPSAIDSDRNAIEIIEPGGNVILAAEGTKAVLGKKIIEQIEQRFIAGSCPSNPNDGPATVAGQRSGK